MKAPFYVVCASSLDVQAVFGKDVRIYPHGLAPKEVAKPYCVYQTIGGSPENYLGERPDTDTFQLQIDVIGTTLATTLAAAQVIRDAIEDQCYITRWGGESKDPDTNLIRYSFDVNWIVPR